MNTIKQRFEQIVHSRADKIAVSYNENDLVKKISYKTLLQDIERLTKLIASSGFKREKIILVGENSYKWIVYSMAVIFSDNILVPFDNRSSLDEIKKAQQKVGAKLIISSNGVNQKIKITESDLDSKFWSIEEKWNANATFEAEIETNPEDLALIMVTSGSTGEKKGVCLSQKNLLADAITAFEHARIDIDDFSNIICLPMYHIYCFAVDMFWIIANGCSACLCSSIVKLVDEIKLYEASRICMVPMMADMILTRLNQFKQTNPDFDNEKVRVSVLGNHFKRIILGGAFIEPYLRDGLRSYGLDVFCGYGMTESTSGVSSEEGSGARPNSVGEILNCNEIKIVENEICIRGDTVMLGYYEDEENTSEALKNGWLHTGDYGYIEDGYLYITGKKKNLIITANGENVSPEELEKYIHESDFVKEVVCFQKNNQICALIYPDFEAVKNKNIEEIRKEIEAHISKTNSQLPFFKHIQNFEISKKELEKTSSMKIKRECYYYGKEQEKKDA